MSEITVTGQGPQIEVDGSGSVVQVVVTTGSGSTGGGVWGAISGTLTDQTDLEAALDGKVPTARKVNGKPLTADVSLTASDVSARPAGDVPWSEVSSRPAAFAPSAHKATHATGGTDPLTPADIGAAEETHAHDAADVTSGIIAPARLGTGTADSRTVLRGDGTWGAAGGNDWAVSAPPTSSFFQGTGKYNATQGVPGAVGTMLLVPFKMLPFSYTAMVIGVVVGGGAGEIVRLGVYERLDDGSCGGLLVDAGTVTVDSGGMKTATMPPFTPSDPNVYLAFVTQGPTKTATFRVHNNNAPVLSTGLMYNNFENQGLFAVTGVTGALPADPTATVVGGFGVPIIGLY